MIAAFLYSFLVALGVGLAVILVFLLLVALAAWCER